MRPLLFILGLAFVASVLIANVDAIKCYNKDGKKVDCDALKPLVITQCVKDGSKGDITFYRGCNVGICENFEGAPCCSSDLCNGAVTSTPSVALFIAVITGVIAAVGI